MSLNREKTAIENVKVVGLTGGIGTGKSTAAAYLKKKGFVHIDADEIGRNITADGSPMLPVLNEIFGPEGAYGEKNVEILRSDGSLDRQALASLVFTDKGRKAQLDKVMFSAIIEEIDRQIGMIQESGNAMGILLDAPLLFEAGLDSRCDVVLLLVADEAVRIERVCKRDGVTPQEVRNRINSQMRDEEKRKYADVIVENSSTRDDLERKLEKISQNFQKILDNRFNRVL